ncbi:glycosyl hydrolase, family 43 [Lentilactobacillus rapi DSM 19907 = JCM 15042]|uniref:Xylan 1,4-beta-xylosidase n=2 Tax=Lentilactobacillus rapi TaxID=481723 RepID=A0A512PMD0_9LACO|nr:glycoside hydrolase family 43 protein [Lentilactobacillus rapi]KRL14869.1 glycosyl hydrolase, family 43 [Lentilactobacillus rapi DSM 19907 = JCM 15042]GEP72356.1 xylan 1,4-beta-xylosidase [Lentilactobacillus rapi]
METIQNPVLTGFNPDPVLFKDDQLYYIVVSTFEWLPGIRVYSSDNLVNWSYETSILNEPRLVNLQGNPTGCSIWGPFASYHDGKFYIVYTNVNATKVPFKDCDNYIITADDIHGPWSDPVYVNSSGFDPSIFFDDGQAYFLNEIWDYRLASHNKPAGIVMQKINSETLELEDKPKLIFEGTSARKTEAPQIYKHNGYYYLLCAEGGTEANHQETIARSKNVWGPYEVDPDNPMLTSKDDPILPLQCAGHASLMETRDHEWYMAHLCTRPLKGDDPILGRETAIQKVVWTDNDWLRLANGTNRPSLETPAPKGVSDGKPISHSFVDAFDGQTLKYKHWNTLRQFDSHKWLIPTSKGLIIKGGQSPQSAFDQHIVATRQTDFNCHASVKLEYHPQSYLELAGMTLYLDLSNYVLLMVTVNKSGNPCVVLQQSIAGEFKQLNEISITNSGKYQLSIQINESQAEFLLSDIDKQYSLGAVDVSFLSGGYTGNFIGLDVIDMYRRNSTQAVFTDFKYSV